MPELTVIIINYNSGGRLPHILEALSQQTYQDFDVLIYDNASEDGSEQVVAPEGVTTRIISSPENLGFAGGVMAAIKETDSEWVAVLNPDAYPEASWLTALTQAAKTYGENTILGSVQLRADIPQILDGLGDVYHISGTAWRGGFG
ncbi:MAG: glycosyltransferase family 2 protein, partial [Pseudomonadota bacterium]